MGGGDRLPDGVRLLTACCNLEEISEKPLMNERYICLLKKWGPDRRAAVLTDVESDEFRIARGRKQGDPLSSLPLNSVPRSLIEKNIETWNEKGLASDWVTRKEIAHSACDLLTTCL